MAIARGSIDAVITVDAAASDLVALLLDADIDLALLEVSGSSSAAHRADGGVFVNYGPPGRYTLTVTDRKSTRADAGEGSGKNDRQAPSSVLTFERERRDRDEARLETLDLRGKL